MITFLKFELKQNLKSWIIWTLSIVIMNILMMSIYSTMREEMIEISAMFDNLGIFSQMMGLTRLNMGTVLGYYGVEIGVVIALGGTMYSAVTAINIMAKETSQQTSEFLFSHPISRFQIVTSKAITVLIYVTLMAFIFWAFAVITFIFFNEPIPYFLLTRYHTLQWIMGLQIAAVCLFLSTILKRENTGLGIGIVLILYILSLMFNLQNDWQFLGYLSPFIYADASYLLLDDPIKTLEFGFGITMLLMTLIATYFITSKKDIY